METGALESSWDYFYYLVGPISGYVLIGLGLIGLFWSAFKTKNVHFQLWAIIVMFFSLPTGLRLMNFRYDYFALVVFIPIVITAAFGMTLLLDRLVNRKSLSTLLIMTAALMLSLGGAIQNANAVNSATILADSSDLEALEWIKTHTPQDARFFVNTTGWGFNVYRGVDGGGWLLPITGRWSLAPTIFFPFGGETQFTETWTAWAAEATAITTCDDNFWQLVDDAQLNYLYIKEGLGSLQPDQLVSCDGINQLVNIEGIHIYIITQPANTP